MPTEESAQQTSTLLYLLHSGGLLLVAAMLCLAVIGVWMIMRPHGKTLVLVFAVLSMLPGIWAILNVFLAASQFTAMASLAEAPKPAEFADVVGRAMANGFYGLLATLVPMSLAILAFMRSRV